MKIKLKILLILVSLALTVSLMSDTYSRYVADTVGSLEVQFAKWKILVNDIDITNGNTSSIELTPVIEENSNVAANKFAPSSKGYFDIEIDPSNVEVSFDYEVTLELLNDNLPDLLISKYSILKSDFTENDAIVTNDIVDNKITGTLKYKNLSTSSDEVFMFEPFTIRVYFEWFDGDTATMSDEDDTLIGTSTDVTSLQIKASVKFEQNLTALPDTQEEEVVTSGDDIF